MPTDSQAPNESFIQSIITAFTEHPEALKTLLENRPINDALAAYLDAAAERLRPEQKWKEIYRARGESQRQYFLKKPMYFPDSSGHYIRVVSGAWLYYDEKFKAAALFGGVTEAEKDWMTYRGFIPRVETSKWIAFFDEESEAILWALTLIPAIEEAFVTATEPIQEAAQDADPTDA